MTQGQRFILVVNYYTSSFVRDLIESLQETTFDVLAVADNSCDSDEYRRLLALSSHDARVRVLRMPRNVGFGAAVNALALHTNPRPEDVLWILNPDVRLVEPTALDTCAAALEHFELVSPVITKGPPDAETVWFAGGSFDPRTHRAGHVGDGAPLGSTPSGSWPTQNLTAAALMTTARVWHDLGGFDETYFLYYEDTDLSQRALAKGMRLGVVGDACVWHAVGQATGRGSEGKSAVYYYFLHRNRLRLLRPGIWKRLDLVTAHGSSFTLRLLAQSVREREGGTRKLWWSIVGIVHGLRGLEGAGRVIPGPASPGSPN